ncbi:hypothetical protein C8J57DRAFT_1534265 [Mycena rebaudengoi]|nr:hypothetical protein C8J57DRAFT_1534265 [Mycena rebaudengoi]
MSPLLPYARCPISTAVKAARSYPSPVVAHIATPSRRDRSTNAIFLRRIELSTAHPWPRSAPIARSSQRRLGVSILESLRTADLNRAHLCITRPNLRHIRTLAFKKVYATPAWVIGNPSMSAEFFVP